MLDSSTFTVLCEKNVYLVPLFIETACAYFSIEASFASIERFFEIKVTTTACVVNTASH